MTHSFRAIIGTLVAAFAIAASALPASAAQVMLVIDGSGSAAGRIGDVRKIDIARRALDAAFDFAPADLSIGVVAYGHRNREACDDFEVLAPPGPAPVALSAAASISPLGRSPIAEATVAAAETFGGPDAEGTVIVITDNADNCAPDPCAIITALHERMPNVTISIVGIAIPAEEVGAITCFTDLTGGLYLRAANATDFGANLRRALDEAWSEPEIPLPVATLTVPDGIVQGRPFTLAYTGPLAAGDQIRLSWFGTSPTEHIVGAVVHEDGTPVVMTAPAERGAYELRYWHAERGAVIATARLQVGTVSASLTAPETVQQGETFEIGWQAEAVGGETIQLTETFSPVDSPLLSAMIRRTNPTVRMTAPAETGRYELRLVLPPRPTDGDQIRGAPEQRVLAQRMIEVVPAQATMNVAGTVLAGERFSVDWTGPAGADDEIILAAEGAAVGDRIESVRPASRDVVFRAPYPEGRYELRYWSAALNRVIATAPVRIELPPATLDAPDQIMGGATVEVSWTGPARIDDRIVIVPASPTIAEPFSFAVVSAFGRPVALDVPTTPGKYEIRYLGGREGAVLIVRPITVLATEIALSVGAPLLVGDPIEVRWEGPGGRYDEIRVMRPLDDPESPLAAVRVTEDRTAIIDAPAEPGLYVLMYWSGTQHRALSAISIDVTCDDCARPAPAEVPLRR